MKYLAKLAIHQLNTLEIDLDKSIVSITAAISKEKANNNNPIVLAMLKGKKKAYTEIATNLGYKLGKVKNELQKDGYQDLGHL